jgi:hypothetical protein
MSWDQCNVFKNILAKMAKNGILTHNKAKLCKNLMTTLVFENKMATFFQKIVFITLTPRSQFFTTLAKFPIFKNCVLASLLCYFASWFCYFASWFCCAEFQELVKEVDPNEQLDDEVENMLLHIADDFIEQVISQF